MPEERKRQVAYKVPIAALTLGKYVKEEGDFTPNYIEFGNKNLSRVNIIGIVVSKDEQQNVLIIEDGTNKITVRSFENDWLPQNIGVGDIVNIIGRPREYNSEKYLLPEIIKKTDEMWMRLRKKEMEKIEVPTQKIEEKKTTDIEVESISDSNKGIIANNERIIEYIRTNDKAAGVEIDQIIKETDIKNCEEIIQNMLKEGDLFENMPGKVKILE